MSNQSVLTLRVPEHLKNEIVEIAGKQGVSMNHLASYMLSRSVAAMRQDDIIARYRTKRSDAEVKADFDAMWERRKAMPPLPDDEIPEWDRWPDGMEPPEL